MLKKEEKIDLGNEGKGERMKMGIVGKYDMKK